MKPFAFDLKPGIPTSEVEALVAEMRRVITHVHFEETPVARLRQEREVPLRSPRPAPQWDADRRDHACPTRPAPATIPPRPS